MYNKIVLFCPRLSTTIKLTADVYITGEESYKYLYASILIMLLSRVLCISMLYIEEWK